jgi:hypothetical protein
MNVAVLAAPEDMRDVVPMLGVFKNLRVPAFGLKIHPSWGTVARLGLAGRLEQATHVLVLSSGRHAGLPWFVFSVGFALGKNLRLVLYRTDAAWDPPAYLARQPILDSLAELENFFLLERGEWAILEEKRAARSALLEIGISFHADSFVQCVSEGQIHAVELFLKAGLHANARDRHGVPILNLAARNRHRAVAELLLEFGAAIDLQSEDRGYSALMDAVLVGSVELADLFLRHGANPDLKSKDGQTALVVAVGRGDEAIVELLLAGKADPDIPDKLGLSARQYARLFNNPGLAALFEAGGRTDGA